MGYDGFLSKAGIELLNEERTRAYINNQMPSFPLVRNFPVSTTLHVALEQAPYESPLIDDAEWVNPSDPDTHGFFGLYPLEITGIGDSTRSAPVVESLTDGGTVGASRDATREVRVHGLLIGRDDLAAEAGLSWLRAALHTSTCGMHGTGCGSSDLRYFLADPLVCNPLYETTLSGGGEDFPIGTVDPSSSPSFITIPRDPASPAKAHWSYDQVDGVVISWGRMSSDNSKILYESDPVAIQRTNFVVNPTFAHDANGWVATAGTVSQVATGGVDGGGYGHVSQADAVLVRYNWIPDPSLVNTDPAASGWRSLTSSVLTTEDPVDPDDPTRILVSTMASGQTVNTAEITLLGPVVSDEGTNSIGFAWSATTAGDVLTVELYDNLGMLVSTNNVTFAGPLDTANIVIGEGDMQGYVLRFSAATDVLTITKPVVTASTDYPDIFFSGSLPAESGVTCSYIGTPLTSASKQVEGDLEDATVALAPMGTRYGDVAASFWLKSRILEDVTVTMIGSDGTTVLGSIVIHPAMTWQKYTLQSPYGRDASMTFSGSGFFDIDQVLVESSEVVGDYFDGDSASAPDYMTSWLGFPNSSPSRVVWTGSTDITYPDGYWRPFIRVHQGSLTNVTAILSYYLPITLEEQLDRYERNYHDVSVVEGPSIIKRFPNAALGIGSAIEVDFVLVAATPFAFSNDRNIPTYGMTTGTYSDPAPEPDPPDPLIDPSCDPLPPAPRPPVIPELCVDEPTDWQRYWIEVPSEDVALWASSVPTITLNTKGDAVSQIRVRFMPNPFSYPVEDVDPLSYCGEFILSYLPANTLLMVNGMSESAFAQVAGGEALPADQLLYGSGGTPMEWAALTCGIDYVMTIDVPAGDTLDDVKVTVDLNRRE